jgi:hypothetical protein
MNAMLKLTATALLLGTATVAAAQTAASSQLFIDQERQFQALSEGGDATNRTPAEPTAAAAVPMREEPFAQRVQEMQILSSHSGVFGNTAEPGSLPAQAYANP